MTNLRNYTTSIPANRSINEIEQLLLDFGADEFMKKTGNGRFVELYFSMNIDGKKIPFKLPANIEKVAKYLAEEYNKKSVRKTKAPEDFADQAYNTAWRVIKDWVHAQLSIIATEMVKAEEVFLPYVMFGDGRTLGEKYLYGDFKKQLPAYEVKS